MTSSPGDFDVGGDRKLWEFAERLESVLESRDMTSQLRQLCAARSARARRRHVVLSRTNRDEALNFHVAGGVDKGGGVFVAKLEPDSKPYTAGLRRGDQVFTYCISDKTFRRCDHFATCSILVTSIQHQETYYFRSNYYYYYYYYYIRLTAFPQENLGKTAPER